jgi:WD40 repeat protein
MMTLTVNLAGKDTALETAFTHLQLNPSSEEEKEIEPIYSEGPNGGIWRVVALDAQKIVSASYDHQAKLWSLGKTEGNLAFVNVQVLRGHTKEVLSVTKITDALFATGSADGTMSFWNSNTGSPTGYLKEKYVAGFYSMTAIDATTVATGSCHKPKQHRGFWNPMIKIWNIAIKKFEFELKGHTSGISALVNLGENLLASSSDDSTVRVWNLNRRSSQALFKYHSDYVYGLASFGKTHLVTASKDRKMKVIDIDAQKEIGEFQTIEGAAHTSTVYDVNTFNVHLAVSASRDGYVKVWDYRTLKCTKVLDPSDGFVYGANFSPDGKIIAGTSGKLPEEGKKKVQTNAHVVAWDVRYS